MVSGGQKQGLSCTYHLTSIQITTGREGRTFHLWQEVTLLYYHQQEEKRFSPPLPTAQPMRDSHNSANEKPLYFELPVSSNGLDIIEAAHLPMATLAQWVELYTLYA